MDDSGMEMNKIAASVLLAGIIAMVAGFMSEGLYSGGVDEDAKRGYSIEVVEDAGGDGAPAADEGPVDITPFLTTADAAAGEKLLKKCTACHTFEKGGREGVGPNQYGLVGRNIAKHPGYKFSDALLAMSDQRWTFQNLSEFLYKPRKFAPGNKMSFAGIKKPQDRANLIVYLNSLSDNPVPLP